MSHHSHQSGQPTVVVVGAGFGGLSAIRALAGHPVDTVLIDRNNYHTFHALLYQVAAAELEPEDISYPVRTILRRVPNARFVMGEVQKVDLAGRAVRMAGHDVFYDYLVLAAGSSTRFFGAEGARENAFELKTLDHAIALRNHILCCLEQASGERDAGLRRRLLTFVIIGGGPTGVESAGALAELVRGPVMKDYPALDPGETRVVLLQAVGTLLDELPEGLRDYALRRLRRIGVDVRLNAVAAVVTGEGVILQDGSSLGSSTVLWTAGVRGSPLAEASGLPAGADGRVAVLPSLQVPGHPEVYVIGDLARFERDGRPLPFTAPPAIQEGVAAASNILRQTRDLPPVPFDYKDRGALATVGRTAAVAYVGGRQFRGFGAWALWLGVHIFNLIGFRNRILVMVNWAWDFLLYERAVRLILPSESCLGPHERASGGSVQARQH